MAVALLIFALVCAHYATGQSSEEHVQTFCNIEGLEIEEYYDYGYGEIENEPVFDDHKGPLLKLKRGSITNVSYGYYEEDIVASIQGDEIIFEFSDEYKNYDFDYETTTRNRNISLYGEIYFTCPEGETYVEFYQQVVDKNNHQPIFNRKVYTYKFGMDIAAGFDLTQLVEIFAVDLDFTDTDLTFTTDSNDYLELKPKYSSNNVRGKTHYTSLVLKQAIVGAFDKTFNIYATDKNEVKQTGKAEVRLIRV